MRLLRLALVAGLLLAGSIGARGQTVFYNQPGAPPGSGTGGFYAVTAGTSSSTALAAAVHNRTLIAIDNESASASIAVCFGSCTPALNTAGSFTIPPGQTRTWRGPYVPADQINVIASAASTPVTVEALTHQCASSPPPRSLSSSRLRRPPSSSAGTLPFRS